MNKIKVSIEYGCYPIWIYDENGDIIDNNLPDEALNDKEFENILDEIQDLYDSCFINTEQVFDSRAFTSEEQEKFDELLSKINQILEERYSKFYEIIK